MAVSNFFENLRRYSRSSRCTTGVNDTGGEWKKSSIIKVLIILFGHLWEVEVTYRNIFTFKFTLRSQQSAIVPLIPVANCHWCHWHRHQICLWYRYTGGKFATGVGDTGGAPWFANISVNFRKNLKRSLWDTLGLGGNWFMKKTRSKKSRDTVPLRSESSDQSEMAWLVNGDGLFIKGLINSFCQLQGRGKRDPALQSASSLRQVFYLKVVF
jgi:hypothetical protein